jgi:hypothetical protein
MMSARADLPAMRSLDTIPAVHVPLYHSIRSPLVCLSICVRIVSIVYPSFNMHSKITRQVSIPDVCDAAYIRPVSVYYVALYSQDRFISRHSLSQWSVESKLWANCKLLQYMFRLVLVFPDDFY